MAETPRANLSRLVGPTKAKQLAASPPRPALVVRDWNEVSDKALEAAAKSAPVRRAAGLVPEEQVQLGGTWSDPTGPVINGRLVLVHNSDVPGDRLYGVLNGGWHYLELT